MTDHVTVTLTRLEADRLLVAASKRITELERTVKVLRRRVLELEKRSSDR